MTCWNNLDLTRIALDSLFRNTLMPYDLYLINNGSVDGTKEYLKGLKRKGVVKGFCEKLIVVNNRENQGNIKPVNKAMLSTGQDVVLLNNDMEFPPLWLSKIRDAAFKYEDVGISGARLCWNPISLGFNLTELEKYYDRKGVNALLSMSHTINLGCSWIKRKVIDKVGVLDEGFGFGYVEDDDYCVRVVLAGFKLQSAEVFIRHFGGAGFNQVKSSINERFNKNKAYFNNKWNHKGIKLVDGASHFILMHHVDECKIRLDVLERKLDKLLDNFGLDSVLEVNY